MPHRLGSILLIPVLPHHQTVTQTRKRTDRRNGRHSDFLALVLQRDQGKAVTGLADAFEVDQGADAVGTRAVGGGGFGWLATGGGFKGDAESRIFVGWAQDAVETQGETEGAQEVAGDGREGGHFEMFQADGASVDGYEMKQMK